MSAPTYVIVNFGPTVNPGNFTVPHGLSHVPYDFEILSSSAILIGQQSPASDSTNVYLTCSDAGATGRIRVW